MPRTVLRRFFRGEFVPLMDHKLGLEYRDVLLRPEHLDASCFSEGDMLDVIDALEAFAEPVYAVVRYRPLSSDPNDDMVLDLAINGNPKAVVTNNAKHFKEAGKRFGVPVVSPAELLRKLREGGKDAE